MQSPQKNLHSLCVIRIVQLAFVRAAFVPSENAEWPARVDSIC